MGARGSRFLDADGPWRSLRMERFQDSTRETIPLVYRGSNFYFYSFYIRPGNRLLLRRPVAEQEGTTRRRAHGRIPLRPRRLSRELLSQQAVVALSELWSYRRSWGWIRVYRSHCRIGEVVSRSKRADHGHCRGRFRRRSIGDGSGSNSAHSDCGRLAHIRISWYCLSCGYNGHRLLHAESAGWLEADRLDPQRDPDRAAREDGLHARWRAEDVAVVGAMGAVVFEYFGRHLDYFARVADVSGDRQDWRGRGRRNGRYSQHWQRRGTNVLGMDLGLDHQAMDVRNDVSVAGRPLLDSARHVFGGDSYSSGVHHPDVLRRRVRDHARLYRRLLRIEECWAHLRTDAHGVGFRERVRPVAHRTHAAKQWIVCERSPCDCRHRRRIDDSAHTGVTTQTQNCRGKGNRFEPSRLC